MNTNWSKILLFSLISFVLGIIVCCLFCMWCQHGGCGRGGSCERGAYMHGEQGHGSCCKGEGHGKKGGMHGEKGSCCSMGHGDHPGDAEAEKIAKELEKANFLGDTTIAIEGGTVRVVRSTDNTSVHVDMKGEEKEVVKEVEVN